MQPWLLILKTLAQYNDVYAECLMGSTKEKWLWVWVLESVYMDVTLSFSTFQLYGSVQVI